jgi:hypothetical protein
MIRTRAEAQALLEDLLPMIQATTDYNQAYGSAFRRGYSQSLGAGPCWRFAI